jgi:hypothetical protein
VPSRGAVRRASPEHVGSYRLCGCVRSRSRPEPGLESRAMGSIDPGGCSLRHPDQASGGVVVDRSEGRHKAVWPIGSGLAGASQELRIRVARRRFAHWDAGGTAFHAPRRRAALRHVRPTRQRGRTSGMGVSRAAASASCALCPRAVRSTIWPHGCDTAVSLLDGSNVVPEQRAWVAAALPRGSHSRRARPVLKPADLGGASQFEPAPGGDAALAEKRRGLRQFNYGRRCRCVRSAAQWKRGISTGSASC